MIHRTQAFSFLLYLILFIVFLPGCTSKKIDHPVFEALDDSRTGLHFNNKLVSTEQLNLFKYMYFYNGSGVVAGDFNNDGKTDLFLQPTRWITGCT